MFSVTHRRLQQVAVNQRPPVSAGNLRDSGVNICRELDSDSHTVHFETFDPHKS